MSSIKCRVERLMQDARKIVWRPHMLLLTGQAGEYQLEIREWDGVPGSARDGHHTKSYTFPDKAAAIAFTDEMMAYWRDRYSLEPSDLLLLDSTFPAEAEYKESVQKARPLALEVIAEREGKTLEEKLRELYGKDADLEALPTWGDILRWDRETT